MGNEEQLRDILESIDFKTLVEWSIVFDGFSNWSVASLRTFKSFWSRFSRCSDVVKENFVRYFLVGPRPLPQADALKDWLDSIFNIEGAYISVEKTDGSIEKRNEVVQFVHRQTEEKAIAAISKYLSSDKKFYVISQGSGFFTLSTEQVFIKVQLVTTFTRV